MMDPQEPKASGGQLVDLVYLELLEFQDSQDKKDAKVRLESQDATEQREM